MTGVSAVTGAVLGWLCCTEAMGGGGVWAVDGGGALCNGKDLDGAWVAVAGRGGVACGGGVAVGG